MSVSNILLSLTKNHLAILRTGFNKILQHYLQWGGIQNVISTGTRITRVFARENKRYKTNNELLNGTRRCSHLNRDLLRL